jgi:hypothetical protein
MVLGFVTLGRARSQGKFRDSAIGRLKQAAGDVHYTKLAVAGDAVERGIYDPSIASAPDGHTDWLAYSSVTGTGNLVQGRLALGQYVHTHLARTTDGGAHWEFVKLLNRSADGTLTMPDGTQLSGAWRYEVSSLVSDPADPDASRRWKLFVHRYFWESTRDRMFTHGWIALRTAADPAGGLVRGSAALRRGKESADALPQDARGRERARRVAEGHGRLFRAGCVGG